MHHSKEVSIYFCCKLQTEPSDLLCHTFFANKGDHSLYTDLSGLHASTDIVRHVHYYYQRMSNEILLHCKLFVMFGCSGPLISAVHKGKAYQ